MSPPAPESILKGLVHLPVQRFKNVKQLRTAVQAATENLDEESGQQYIVFGPVRANVADKLNDSDKGLGSSSRISYDEETKRLIVKLMPSPQHEAFTYQIARQITKKLDLMGVDDCDLLIIGTATYKAPGSSKQPDMSFKPATRKTARSPPSIVFESGWSESLPQLRNDAAWWLTNSNELVNIVILIAIRAKVRALIIEKWILGEGTPLGGTRSRPKPPTKMPIKETEICIQAATKGSTTYEATGAPLVFEFARLHDRPAVPPQNDVVISGAELCAITAKIWDAMQEGSEEEVEAEEEG